MEYILENEALKVTVTQWGAQVKSVIRKSDGVEHIWQADPAVWGYHAPILFPYCGKLRDGAMEAEGTRYEHLPQHGFARTSRHQLVSATAEKICLELTHSPETLAVFPFPFRLLSTFTLEGDTLRHTLMVENPGDGILRFGLGYHPAFALPFDETRDFSNYYLEFSQEESPLCLDTAPAGLVSGKIYSLGSNLRRIPITAGMFDQDSHCMINLRSKTLGLFEQDTGRGVVCDISDFPYTLIWSKTGVPQFICIEPWHSLPDGVWASGAWEQKPSAAALAPGESWSATLKTRFVR